MRSTKSLRWWTTLSLLAATACCAQTSVSQLAKPPAAARHFIIESTGGKHGDSWSWVAADGTRMGRESMNLRGQIVELDSSGKPGADGMPAALTIRGFTPAGDAAESFGIDSGTGRWQSQLDSGSAHYQAPAFYAAISGPIDLSAWLLERLLASPDHTLSLLPSGKAHADRLTSVRVESSDGSTPQTVDLWLVSGINSSPVPFWADANGKFFAQTQLLGWLPEEYATAQARLEEAQATAIAARAPALFKSLVTIRTQPVAFAHVRMFDADGLRFLSDRTVVVRNRLIAAAGPAQSTPIPSGSLIIDGRGKTLVPGLWDCHLHVGDDFTGVQELSLGVTSVRDPGNNDLLTIDRRTRTAASQLLFPHVYPSSLIDGKGPYSAQVANIATSQAEAIALIDKAKANGFTGIKFYGTFNQQWLPASIAEAHKLGLHVHGHIPAGIRPMEAIDDGYDEVTHINWIIMQALPDSVIAVSNSAARFEGPGRYGKDVDLDGAPMQLIIKTMARKPIYSDPTMVFFESLYVPDNGDMSPSYAPFVGTLPPMIERNFRSGGLEVPKDLTRADYRASWKKMVELLARMHEAGIPIVAGTDGSGIEIIHELEIYRDAGFTAAEALAAATIVPARLVGEEAHTGSIKVGKTADLTLVEGDPSVQIAALRQTRVVMLDGKMLDADALRGAAGFMGRPH